MFERIWNLFRRSPASSVAVGAIPLRQDEGPEIVERRIPRAGLDPDAVKIVQRLTRYRHASYLVGGCVRDLLLGLKPKDFDIATSATPRQVKRLFRNSRVIGRRFRLAHVYFRDGKIIEVATFRSQEEGNDDSDGDDVMIRDDNVFGTLAEDALRRDFTINQLYYDLEGAKVIDHAHGLADLERRLVRTIGEPELRFREDPIRILRAIKFAARLDLSIDLSGVTSDDDPQHLLLAETPSSSFRDQLIATGVHRLIVEPATDRRGWYDGSCRIAVDDQGELQRLFHAHASTESATFEKLLKQVHLWKQQVPTRITAKSTETLLYK